MLATFFSAKDMAAHQFNFWHAGHELDENLIFVNSPSNDWYLSGVPGLGHGFEDTAAAMARWAEALAVSRTVAIGTSMGGFAAIRYGSSLGADVLAFSTDAVIRDAGSRSAAYFKGREIPEDFDLRTALPEGGKPVHLMVGEADPRDLHAAWLLSSNKAVTAISLIGADHYLPTHLTRQIGSSACSGISPGQERSPRSRTPGARSRSQGWWRRCTRRTSFPVRMTGPALPTGRKQRCGSTRSPRRRSSCWERRS